MKKTAKVFLILSAAVATFSLLFAFTGGWNALLALVVGGPLILILLAVAGLLSLIDSATEDSNQKLKFGIFLLILSGPLWFYHLYILQDSTFFIPNLPLIAGILSAILGAVLVVVGLLANRKKN